jgi:beta-glucosidase-like glycosyl hydrolase
MIQTIIALVIVAFAAVCLLLSTIGLYGVVTTHVVARTDFLAENPELVRSVIAAEIAAIDLINEDPERARELVNDAIESATGDRVDEELLAAAWPNVEFTVDPIASSLFESAAHAENVELLDPVDLDGIYDLDILNELLTEIQTMATRDARLGIPVLYGIDFVHGANYAQGGTIFPHNIGIAATFDRALARRVGEVTGDELRAVGIPWNFAPVLDVGRHPAWPRFYETFGEDPWLAGTLGREVIAGMQAGGRAAATAKHYLAYGAPHSGRDRAPTLIATRAVREHHLPPFRAATLAGVRAVMYR